MFADGISMSGRGAGGCVGAWPPEETVWFAGPPGEDGVEGADPGEAGEVPEAGWEGGAGESGSAMTASGLEKTSVIARDKNKNLLHRDIVVSVLGFIEKMSFLKVFLVGPKRSSGLTGTGERSRRAFPFRRPILPAAESFSSMCPVPGSIEGH